MRELVVIGLSWRTAPVDLRERLAFSDSEIPEVLDALREGGEVAEAVLLSTCNRVEIYAATNRSAPESARDRAAAAIRNYLAGSRNIDSEVLAGALYEHSANGAVKHIFRVASSLDSMVVGESQILGQLKDAYGRAVAAGATGPVLSRCLERAFRVAKRVRTETEISKGAANISSVAVELASRVFGDLTSKSVLLLGAGKMGALAARHLRGAGAGSVVVANRSPKKAEELAEQVEGTARPWKELTGLLAGADVVISSTGSKEPVLTKKLVKKALKKRRYAPMVIVDIAVPRDADPAIGAIDGVFLFNIDDLEKVVAENIRQRTREADAATSVVLAEVGEFESWSRAQSVVPTIRTLRQHFTEIASAEAERALAGISRAEDAEKREALTRQLADRIAKKLLHAPMLALKQGDADDLDQLVRLARTLFGLVEEAEEEIAAEGALEASPEKAD